MIKFLILLLFFNKFVLAGEIDGKGVICIIYGNTVGFFFNDNRTYEYKPKGGKDKLELQKKEIGKYYTDENFIYFDDVKINRKNLLLQKYSSFRGECKAYENMKDFEKNFDLESLTKENKI